MFIDRNVLLTLAPNFEKAPSHLSKFRWGVMISLPFPFPSKQCVKRTETIDGRKFKVEIHNHYNRILATTKQGTAGPMYFRVLLEDKRQPKETYENCVSFSREPLPAVVIFEELKEYDTPNDAFSGANDKISRCFEWLGAFLTACQRSAPYMAAWLIYPISHFDVGTVYHQVTADCAKHRGRHLFASAASISFGRHLSNPLFAMDVPAQNESAEPMDTANELLAEALMSLFRGMPRLAVLNSYTAVESFANVVFATSKIERLVANNVPREIAEEVVEDERKRHRTEASFLYHRGMKSATDRSLHDERKDLYSELLKLQDLRHRVAHTGYKPLA